MYPVWTWSYVIWIGAKRWNGKRSHNTHTAKHVLCVLNILKLSAPRIILCCHFGERCMCWGFASLPQLDNLIVSWTFFLTGKVTVNICMGCGAESLWTGRVCGAGPSKWFPKRAKFRPVSKKGGSLQIPCWPSICMIITAKYTFWQSLFGFCFSAYKEGWKLRPDLKFSWAPLHCSPENFAWEPCLSFAAKARRNKPGQAKSSVLRDNLRSSLCCHHCVACCFGVLIGLGFPLWPGIRILRWPLIGQWTFQSWTRQPRAQLFWGRELTVSALDNEW